MKRYKVSLNNGEYRKDTESELPLAIRECIEKLIDVGESSGTIDIPGFRCEFSVCPEQCFPEDTIADIHRICAECRAMAEELRQLDYNRFWQTAAVIGTCATRLTAAIKREHARKSKDTVNQLCSVDENTNLCPYHATGNSGQHLFRNPDCPKCDDSESESESAEAKRMLCVWHSDGKTGIPCGRVNYLDSACSECRNILNAESAE